MSAKDVQVLEALFRKTVGNMTAGGVRIDPGPANNREIIKYRFTLGTAGHDFSSCGEQADFLQSVFEGVRGQLDDDWTFESATAAFPNPAHENFPMHRWFEGRSSNPDDDVIVVDPWNNKFQHHPRPATTPTPPPPAEHVQGPSQCTCGTTHPTSHEPGPAACWCTKVHNAGICAGNPAAGIHCGRPFDDGTWHYHGH